MFYFIFLKLHENQYFLETHFWNSEHPCFKILGQIGSEVFPFIGYKHVTSLDAITSLIPTI